MRLRTWLPLLCISGLLAAGPAHGASIPGGLLHPVPGPPPCLLAACQALPDCARDHVYIYLINGLDPLELLNFRGVQDYIQALGFCHAYYGQMWHVPACLRHIRRTQAADPQARFVLIGDSLGANLARDMTCWLQEDGIPVQVLIYLGGDTVFNKRKNRPANACRVVNVRAWGLVFLGGGLCNGQEIDGCANYRLPGFVRHANVPQNPYWLNLLGRELYLAAAGGVPWGGE